MSATVVRPKLSEVRVGAAKAELKKMAAAWRETAGQSPHTSAHFGYRSALKNCAMQLEEFARRL